MNKAFIQGEVRKNFVFFLFRDHFSHATTLAHELLLEIRVSFSDLDEGCHP